MCWMLNYHWRLFAVALVHLCQWRESTRDKKGRTTIIYFKNYYLRNLPEDKAIALQPNILSTYIFLAEQRFSPQYKLSTWRTYRGPYPFHNTSTFLRSTDRSRIEQASTENVLWRIARVSHRTDKFFNFNGKMLRRRNVSAKKCLVIARFGRQNIDIEKLNIRAKNAVPHTTKKAL